MPPGRSRRDVRVAIDDFSRRALRDGEQIVAALDDAPMIQPHLRAAIDAASHRRGALGTDPAVRGGVALTSLQTIVHRH